MGRRRALIAVVPLGLAGTAAAQTGGPASSAAFPQPTASAAAPAPTAAGSPPAAPPAPAAPSPPVPAPPPASAPSASPPPAPPPPPGYAPYPPYPPPYYYPWPPPGAYYEAPRDTRPATLPYDGRPAPPGYHVESRVRRGAVLAGSLMFGITYGLQVLVATSVDYEDESEWLLVPVVGSWVFMGEVCDRGNADDGCSFLALHGLTQTAGAALLVYGIASKKQQYVRDEAGFQLAPARLGSGYGFTARGRF